MKRLIAAALFVVFVCSLVPCLAGGTWIAAVPGAESVKKGETVEVTVRMGWWEASPGFALVRVTYDNKLLELVSVDQLDSRVSAIGGAGKGELTVVCRPTNDMTAGTGEFDLVKLTFTALKKGDCAVKPVIASVTDGRWTAISSESSYTVIAVK